MAFAVSPGTAYITIGTLANVSTSLSSAITVTAGSFQLLQNTGTTGSFRLLQNSAAYSSASTYVPQVYWAVPVYASLPGAAELERRARAETSRAEHRRELARARQALERADARARELLLALLTDEQARTYQQDGWFDVLGSDGGLFRIINRGQAGNVEELAGGQAIASYCCHPPGRLPDADAHAAQLLHLQTDEKGFRRTANRTWLLRAA